MEFGGLISLIMSNFVAHAVCELPDYQSKNGHIYAVSKNGTEVPLKIKGINWFGMETYVSQQKQALLLPVFILLLLKICINYFIFCVCLIDHTVDKLFPLDSGITATTERLRYAPTQCCSKRTL